MDIMLGTIAIMEGKRDLEGYIEDLHVRGQDEIRIEHIKAALSVLDRVRNAG